MSGDWTHASFFSGVGGLDLGLERAGWRTVSFSEIDPYACAVLAERWPGVPNLGDILDLPRGWAGSGLGGDQDRDRAPDLGDRWGEDDRPGRADRDWRTATLWSGGFPCQDLSVAGKRRGFGLDHRVSRGVQQPRGSERGPERPADAGPEERNGGPNRGADDALTRSGLAFAFLDLVAVHRPRAVLLENVPGLLSSHGGRDMAALVGSLVDIGYGVSWRCLDARHFGVPQRRRRVFIVALRSDPDDPGGRVAALRAAEVLAVGSRCGRHPPTGIEAWEEPAAGAGDGAPAGGGYVADIAGSLSIGGHVGIQPNGQDAWTGQLIAGAPPDAGRVRAADGLARRLDDRDGLAQPWITSGEQMIDASGHHRERIATDVTPTLNSYAVPMGSLGPPGEDDPFLPPGLDSHRYRCCGNGVVSSVAEWVGRRLIEVLDA